MLGFSLSNDLPPKATCKQLTPNNRSNKEWWGLSWPTIQDCGICCSRYTTSITLETVTGPDMLTAQANLQNRVAAGLILAICQDLWPISHRCESDSLVYSNLNTDSNSSACNKWAVTVLDHKWDSRCKGLGITHRDPSRTILTSCNNVYMPAVMYNMCIYCFYVCIFICEIKYDSDNFQLM